MGEIDETARKASLGYYQRSPDNGTYKIAFNYLFNFNTSALKRYFVVIVWYFC